jgi:hypothetical protein
MKRKSIYEKPSMKVLEIDTVSIIAESPLQSPENKIEDYQHEDQKYDGTFSW